MPKVFTAPNFLLKPEFEFKLFVSYTIFMLSYKGHLPAAPILPNPPFLKVFPPLAKAAAPPAALPPAVAPAAPPAAAEKVKQRLVL